MLLEHYHKKKTKISLREFFPQLRKEDQQKLFFIKNI
jgi:hypothetical protein